MPTSPVETLHVQRAKSACPGVGAHQMMQSRSLLYTQAGGLNIPTGNIITSTAARPLWQVGNDAETQTCAHLNVFATRSLLGVSLCNACPVFDSTHTILRSSSVASALKAPHHPKQSGSSQPHSPSSCALRPSLSPCHCVTMHPCIHASNVVYTYPLMRSSRPALTAAGRLWGAGTAEWTPTRVISETVQWTSGLGCSQMGRACR